MDINLENLFLAAAKLPPTERQAYLDQACQGNTELRRRVEQLLQAHDQAGGFLDSPAEQPTALHPPVESAEQAGSSIGPYRLLERIGEGGMGVVWVAQQLEPVKRKVAIKLIREGMDSRAVLARFEAERQALAVMDHPNIARVLDGGLHRGRPFFVMELVKGVPITQFCDQRKLTLRDRLELFMPVCQAIQHAHQKGIIHRDIKPSNVLVALYDDRPVVKVIDFGVAKATGGQLTERTLETGIGAVVGTPTYMSPEQASLNNLDIDTRSDVYSLGVLLYELLAGSPPFSSEELHKQGLLEMLRMVREVDPPRPSIKLSTTESLPSISASRGAPPKTLAGLLRSELDWIVMKALEKDRSRRYESASGFAADIQRYLAGDAVLAHPPGALYRLRKFTRRNRVQVTAAAAVLAALLAGVVGTSLALREARIQAALARSEAELKETALAQEAAQRQRAVAREQEALEAVAAEKQARIREQQERTFAEAIAAFVRDDVLALTSVEGQDRFGATDEGLDKDTTVGELLARAAAKLEQRENLEPRIEAELRWIMGVNLRGTGSFAESVRSLERCAELRTELLGREHPDTITALNSLAVSYGAAGQREQELQSLQETYRLASDHLGPDNPLTLGIMDNLAGVWLNRGQPEMALPLATDALARAERKFGPKNLCTLVARSTLAQCHQTQGHPERAQPMLESCVEDAESTLGPNHGRTLAMRILLGDCWLELKRPDKALPIMEETAARIRRTLGEDHPLAIRSAGSLAAALLDVGRRESALLMYEQTVKQANETLGATHPVTLAASAGLANAYRLTGKIDLALQMLESVLEARTEALGSDHAETLVTAHNLGVLHWMSGQPEQAVPLLEQAFQGRARLLGRDSRETLSSMANLAVGLVALGRAEEALPMLEEARQRSEEFRELGWVAPHLFEAAASAGRREQVVMLLPEMLADMRRALPPNSPPLAGGLARVSLMLLQVGAFEEAESCVRESLEIRQRAQPDHWTTHNTRAMLGAALLGQKKYADAEPLLLEGYEGMKSRESSIPPEGLPRLTESLDRLVELYQALDRTADLEKYRTLRAQAAPEATDERR